MSSAPDPVRLAAQQRPRAVIFGFSGTSLTGEEKAFFRDAQPLGFILFSRNIENPGQLKTLTSELSSLLGRQVPVLIDQEGGRVQRLRPPHWQIWPAAKNFGDGVEEGQGLEEAAARTAQNYAALAAELQEGGVTVNCAPVLDLLTPQTDHSIGDRAFSIDKKVAVALGIAACRGHLSQGVLPVIKHLPGLGRAALDTHEALPVIDCPVSELEAEDFYPFRQIVAQDFAGAVWGMVGHAVYRALDPEQPASCSRRVIDRAIRQAIGFDGLLLSDDLDMGALAINGSVAERAEKALEAGCDIVLQCNGDLPTMKSVAEVVPEMSAQAAGRYNRSLEAMAQFRKSQSLGARQAV